jgi:hypothetical protein
MSAFSFLMLAIFAAGFWAGRQSTVHWRSGLEAIRDRLTDYGVSRESLRDAAATALKRS